MTIHDDYPPLEVACTECQGVGLIEAPEWEEWHEAYGETRQILRRRARVKGKLNDVDRKILTEAEEAMPSGPEEVYCDRCDGVGKMLTDFGEDVLRACTHHLQVDVPNVGHYGRLLRK